MPACILKYIARGVPVSRQLQADLIQELEETIETVNSVVVQPVVDGYSIEIEVEQLGPFSRTSFEPYIAEHVLPEAVKIRCGTTPDLKLLKAHFA